MLCHTPTLTSVGLEVARKTATEVVAGDRGKSSKLRTLPVINASDEARLYGKDKVEV